MFVVLIGGELASELHHGTGAVAPDKGAIYFGRIVSGQGPGAHRWSGAPDGPFVRLRATGGCASDDSVFHAVRKTTRVPR